MYQKKIVLVTSGQPSLNPRLVKEADALQDAGYDVTVIYLYWNDWATKADVKLFEHRRWKAKRVGGDPAIDNFLYLFTRGVYKISKQLCKLTGIADNAAELAVGRAAWLLSKAACMYPADLYIGHNLAALPAVVKAAKKNHAKCGFDAEDFHRNETSDDPENFSVRLSTFIEEKYFPRLDYLTSSSPEIASKYQQLFPLQKTAAILNVFPRYKGKKSDPWDRNTALKLFWFSQSVGLSRGIQDIISSMRILEKEHIEFHILGSIDREVKLVLDRIIANLSFNIPPKIIYHHLIDPDKLFEFASQFDIGIASEPGFSMNNNIALSNKLFTYIHAGLAVLVSDTVSQNNFIGNNPEVGLVYKRGDANSITEIIIAYLNKPELINTAKAHAYQLGQNTLNWENEQKKFLSIIREILNELPTNEI